MDASFDISILIWSLKMLYKLPPSSAYLHTKLYQRLIKVGFACIYNYVWLKIGHRFQQSFTKLRLNHEWWFLSFYALHFSQILKILPLHVYPCNKNNVTFHFYLCLVEDWQKLSFQDWIGCWLFSSGLCSSILASSSSLRIYSHTCAIMRNGSIFPFGILHIRYTKTLVCFLKIPLPKLKHKHALSLETPKKNIKWQTALWWFFSQFIYGCMFSLTIGSSYTLFFIICRLAKITFLRNSTLFVGFCVTYTLRKVLGWKKTQFGKHRMVLNGLS